VSSLSKIGSNPRVAWVGQARQLRRRAIAPGEKAPHHKDDDGVYDGADQPCAFTRLIPADRLPDVGGDERTDNPKNGGQLKSRRFCATTLEAITRALNERGIRSARGTRWYASSVANLLSRANKLAEVL
jgi:hypothetical protein